MTFRGIVPRIVHNVTRRIFPPIFPAGHETSPKHALHASASYNHVLRNHYVYIEHLRYAVLSVCLKVSVMETLQIKYAANYGLRPRSNIIAN